jgi:DinB family protein
MDPTLKTSIWQQFGASIDYLADTMSACPDHLWLSSLWLTPNAKPERAQFWYVVYHTLFWLDLYLTGAEEGFLPPNPFTLIEQDGDDPLPERVYTKDELQAYLNDCRKKCQATIEALTDETAHRRCRFGWGECSFLELLLYNMRHVHGHASQLNMLLGQIVGPQRDYVTQARKEAS